MDLELTKTKSIRIYPSRETKAIFKKWLGVYRLVYNTAVSLYSVREGPFPKGWMDAKCILLNNLPEFCKEVPYQIKSMAVNEAYSNRTKAIKKYIKTGRISNMSFKSKKNPVQSCYISKSAIKDSGIYHTLSGKLRYAEDLPDNICDSRLVYKSNRWFLQIPNKVTTYYSENQGKVVSLDPGIRKFMSYYSEDSAGFLGIDSSKILMNKLLRLDELISLRDRSSGRKKYKLKKALVNARYRVKCLVDELHWKCIRFLVDNFDTIILPNFKSSELVAKGKRKLKDKSVRQLLTLSHFTFSQRLLFKCQEMGKKLVRCSEAYTSKTASWTGEIIKDLGGSKTITSNGVTLDRDINGARGIFLRALLDKPEEFVLRNLRMNSSEFVSN